MNNAVTEKKIWVPVITDENLAELAERIKPVVKKGSALRYIEDVGLRTVAFTWSPTLTKKAKGLEPICDITTYHSYGAPNMFKPSIAEVISQIPEKHLTDVVAFQITSSPDTVDDLNREIQALNAGYHVATTTLYRLKN